MFSKIKWKYTFDVYSVDAPLFKPILHTLFLRLSKVFLRIMANFDNWWRDKKIKENVKIYVYTKANGYRYKL